VKRQYGYPWEKKAIDKTINFYCSTGNDCCCSLSLDSTFESSREEVERENDKRSLSKRSVNRPSCPSNRFFAT